MSFPDATSSAAVAPPLRAREALVKTPGRAHAVTAGTGERRGVVALSVLAFVGLWLVTRPYDGIIHDSTLYTLQALSNLDPALQKDVFVSESFQKAAGALFNATYAGLIAWVGLIPANAGLTLAAGLGWVGALLFLCRSLFAGRDAQVAAVVAVLALSPLYSGDLAFAYGEAFITARLPAEAVALLGLAAWASGRRLLALAILVLAFAIHPLMGIGALAMAVLQAAWADRRWLWLPLPAAAAAALWVVLNGSQVPSILLTTYDSAWEAVVQLRDPCCFVAGWEPRFAASITACVAVLLSAWRFADARERPWIVSTLAVGLMGILATLVGSDLFKNVFLTSAQPWRALWLMILLGNAWIGVLLVRMPGSWAARAMLGWSALGSVLVHLGLAVVPAAQLTVLSLGVAWVETRRGPLSSVACRFVSVLVPSVVLLCLAATLVVGFGSDNRAQVIAFAWQVALTVGIAASVLLLARTRSRLPVLAATLFVVAAAASFDRRTLDQRQLGMPETQPGMAELVGPGRNVYWSGATRWMWFDLRRPVYFSCAQGAGALFSKPLADSFSRKAKALAPLKTQDFQKGTLCDSWGAADPGARVAGDTLATACRALPDLDAIILPYPVSGMKAAASWQPLAEPGHDVQPGANLTYHRYDCGEAVRALGDPGAPSGG